MALSFLSEAGIDDDAAKGVLPFALGDEAVALDELVLQPADVGVLRREFDRPPMRDDLGNGFFDLFERTLLIGEGFLLRSLQAEFLHEEMFHLCGRVALEDDDRDIPLGGFAEALGFASRV